MISLRKSPHPLWVLEHQQRRQNISNLLAYLQDTPEGDIITDDIKDRIEFNPLDYETGTTHPSVTPYFGRRVDLNLPKKVNLNVAKGRIRKAGKLPEQEKDKSMCQIVTRQISSQIGRHYRELEFTHKPPYEWEDLANNFSSKQKHKYKATKSHSKIQRAVEIVEERRNHRIALLETHTNPDQTIPTITEIQVLLHLMHDGSWERSIWWQLQQGHRIQLHKKTHHVVPVLLVTTFLGGKVRVIWGYFDQKLRVQYTELQQFTALQLSKNLDDIIQWVLPLVKRNTTSALAMPSIEESEEEEDEDEDEGEEKDSTTEDSEGWESLEEEQVYEQSAPCCVCNRVTKRRKPREKIIKRRRP